MEPSRSLIKAFLIFPVNVMGVVPALLIWCSRPGGVFEGFSYSFHDFRSVTGIFLVVAGLRLCWITVSLFTEVGEGTPAPFDPPKKLVIEGPYVYMRNPMMLGVWLVLLGEALVFGSVLLAGWFLVCCGLSLVLIPLWEEPDLENRLGESYQEYKRKVPRWIPKIPIKK